MQAARCRLDGPVHGCGEQVAETRKKYCPPPEQQSRCRILQQRLLPKSHPEDSSFQNHLRKSNAPGSSRYCELTLSGDSTPCGVLRAIEIFAPTEDARISVARSHAADHIQVRLSHHLEAQEQSQSVPLQCRAGPPARIVRGTRTTLPVIC